jgi:hypothetical protein
MPTPAKIDLAELHKMVAKGKSIRELAKHFDVSISAIFQAKKKINAQVVRGAAITAHRIVSRHNDVVSRMQKSLDEYDKDLVRLLDLLEQAATVGEKTSVLKVKSEIMDRQGKQISRIVDTMRAMADFQVMATFIGEVLTTIERVNKDEKTRIIRSLEDSCGSSISAFLRASDKVSRTFQGTGSSDAFGGRFARDDGGGGDEDVPGESSRCDGE